MPVSNAKTRPNPLHKKANESRQHRYKTDPNYRDRVRVHSRNVYRQKHKLTQRRDCSQNLGNLSSIGAVRRVKCADNRSREISCLCLVELCKALGGYYLDNVRDWIYKGMFPPPIHFAPVDSTGKSRMGIYTEEEVTALINAFSEHQKAKAYYTAKDTATKNLLFASIREARKRQKYGTKAA